MIDDASKLTPRELDAVTYFAFTRVRPRPGAARLVEAFRGLR